MLKKQSLFYSIFKALSVSIIIPMLVVAVAMIRIDKNTLEGEALSRQKNIAAVSGSSAALSLYKSVSMLDIFVEMHTSFSNHHTGLDKEDLQYLLNKYHRFKVITFLNKTGRTVYSAGGRINLVGQELDGVIAVAKGSLKRYFGPVRTAADGKKSMVFAVPAENGVLAAEFDLSEVIAAFEKTELSKGMSAVLYSAEGVKVASVGPADDVFIKKMWEGTKFFSDKFTAAPDGEKYSVFRYTQELTGWSSYVFQPEQSWFKLIIGNKKFTRDFVALGICTILFIFLCAHLFIKPIINPLKELQAATNKIARGRFDALPSLDNMPRNEIGELANSFLRMAEEIQAREEELESTKEALAHSNILLERRIRERTEELQKAMASLIQKEKLATMGEMAAVISHEIRNPLMVISNSTAVLRALAGEENPKLAKQFNIIEAEVKQANKIIAEVLGFARNSEPSRVKTEINGYVRDVLLSYPFPGHIVVEEHLEQRPAYSEIDTEQMTQAFRNIIGNAVEVMPGGGVLKAEVFSGKKAIRICITDYGPGMKEEVREKIFTPFFTTKARGTGLGLAVVRKTISNNKAKIFVRTKEGQGSTFAIYLRRI